MIRIISNDFFIEKNFIELLAQKNFVIDQDNNFLPFAQITINVDLFHKIDLLINDQKKNFLLPINFSDLCKNIIYFLNLIDIQKGEIIFYPFKEEIQFKKKTVKLKHIHNKIFIEAIRNPNGINKTNLYHMIWPLDKEVSINKIDTHLTNLKNYLLEELGYKLNFKSSSQKLVLNFD